MADHKLKKIPVSKAGEYSDSPAIHPHPYPPTFSVGEKQMPEIADWEQGEKYRLIVEVHMSEKSGEEGDPVHGRFEIVAYKHLKEKTIEEMTDEEFGEHKDEALSGSHKDKY